MIGCPGALVTLDMWLVALPSATGGLLLAVKETPQMLMVKFRTGKCFTERIWGLSYKPFKIQKNFKHHPIPSDSC